MNATAAGGDVVDSPESSGERSPRTSRRRSDLPAWAAWGAVVVAVGIAVAVQWNSVAPVYRADEIGNLGNAMLFANPSTTWLLTGQPYMPGMSILLTPLWLGTMDPEVVYRGAIVLVAIVGVLCAVPAARIAREFGVPRNAAIVCGAIVVVAPVRALEGNYVWAEHLVSLLVLWSVALLLQHARERTVRSGVLVALAFAGTYLAHGRALPWALMGIAVAAFMVRRSPRALLATLATGLAVGVLAQGLFGYISSELYIRSDRFGSTLDAIAEISPLGLAESVATQLWYQTVAWAGLTVVGGLVLAAKARRGQWRSVHAVLLAMMGAMTAAVTVLVADPQRLDARLDLGVYGRYLDPFLVPLAVVGLAALWRQLSRKVILATAVIAVVASVAFLLIRVPSLPVGAGLTPGHLPGVAHLFHPEYFETTQEEAWLSIVAVGCATVLVMLLLSRWPRVALAALLVGFAALTIFSDVTKFDRGDAVARQHSVQVDLIASVPTEIPLHGESSSPHAYINGNEFTWWTTPRAYIYIDPLPDAPAIDLMVGDLDSEFAAERGAWPLRGSIVGNSAVWVFPGALRDELDAQGLVLHPRESDG